MRYSKLPRGFSHVFVPNLWYGLVLYTGANLPVAPFRSQVGSAVPAARKMFHENEEPPTCCERLFVIPASQVTGYGAPARRNSP